MKKFIIAIVATVAVYQVGLFLLPFLIPMFFGYWFLKFLLGGENEKMVSSIEAQLDALIK